MIRSAVMVVVIGPFHVWGMLSTSDVRTNYVVDRSELRLPSQLTETLHVDFEPDPSGRYPNGSVAQDEIELIDQFATSHFMRFGLDMNGDGRPDGKAFLTLEQSGDEDPDPAFYYDATREADRAAPGYEDRLGRFFAFARFSGPGESAIILLDRGAATITGEIWDIDGVPRYGTERWLVEAIDATGAVVESVESPVGDQSFKYDGKPWPWELQISEAQIRMVRMRFTGTKKDGIGLALDNFSIGIPVTPEIVKFQAFLPFGITKPLFDLQ